MVNKNDFFNGKKGTVFIDGTEIGTITKGVAKTKKEYESFSSPNGAGKIRVPTGETHTISITYKPTSQDDFDAFNESDDITVILANENINGKATKRLKCINVTFDEETLVEFEKDKVGEIELSGEFEEKEWLQK